VVIEHKTFTCRTSFHDRYSAGKSLKERQLYLMEIQVHLPITKFAMLLLKASQVFTASPMNYRSR
jgi:hypothetical protein